MVERVVFADELPLRVEYSLTALGISLIPVVNAAKQWAQANLKTIEARQRAYDEAQTVKQNATKN